MINKNKLHKIYEEFFKARVKNPLVTLKLACDVFDLDEEEAKGMIKNHLFSLNNNGSLIISTNPTGFKLLHIYALEKENRMNINQNKKGENQ